jgi:hypothetical protein
MGAVSTLDFRLSVFGFCFAFDGAALISDRAPSSEGHEQSRAVDRPDRADRRVLVTDFKTLKLGDEFVVEVGVRIQHIERSQLDGQNGLGWRRLDSHCIPNLGNFHADPDRRLIRITQTNDFGARPELQDKRFRVDRRRGSLVAASPRSGDGSRAHDVDSGEVPVPAGGRVVKKRAICWSNM